MPTSQSTEMVERTAGLEQQVLLAEHQEKAAEQALV
jgi:hypothetical protein